MWGRVSNVRIGVLLSYWNRAFISGMNFIHILDVELHLKIDLCWSHWLWLKKIIKVWKTLDVVSRSVDLLWHICMYVWIKKIYLSNFRCFQKQISILSFMIWNDKKLFKFLSTDHLKLVRLCFKLNLMYFFFIYFLITMIWPERIFDLCDYKKNS